QVHLTQCVQVSLTQCVQVSLTQCVQVHLTQCVQVSLTQCVYLTQCVQVSLTQCVQVYLTQCVQVLTQCVQVSLTQCVQVSLTQCVQVSLLVGVVRPQVGVGFLGVFFFVLSGFGVFVSEDEVQFVFFSTFVRSEHDGVRSLVHEQVLRHNGTAFTTQGIQLQC
uniref:Uncharacterized protein n=1 Tax=Cyclopterus lumpus TaxID=8103 RepID=A0A8C3G5K3_CYCLU